MCETCVERNGDAVCAKLDAFVEQWPTAEYGPAHIVLGDTNIEPWHVRWCLGLIVGELSRRGANVARPTHPHELRGVTDIETGRLGNDTEFYADCATDELIATASFLRSEVLPLVACDHSSAPNAEMG